MNWTVCIGTYSLQKDEVGKPLGYVIKREHDDFVSALLDLERAIDNGEGHQKGWPMGCKYMIVDSDGISMSFDRAYEKCFGVAPVFHDNRVNTYPKLREAECKT